eukprot:8247626-Alexandrium_andersonii.AAC.1
MRGAAQNAGSWNAARDALLDALQARRATVAAIQEIRVSAGGAPGALHEMRRRAWSACCAAPKSEVRGQVGAAVAAAEPA